MRKALPVLGSIVGALSTAWAAGGFGEQQVLTTMTLHPVDVVAADMDGDGDTDVVTGSDTHGGVVWFENLDGQGRFGTELSIGVVVTARGIYVADLDGDLDNDVVVADRNGGRIVWFENLDGTQAFGPPQEIVESPSPEDVHGGDVDGDGDIDLLATFPGEDKVTWYENQDGQGDFGFQMVIAQTVDGAWSVTAGDVDGDGDTDVLSAALSGDEILWHENTVGGGNFWPTRVITTETDMARSVFAEDLDGDGDTDVLSASWSDGKVAWYRNLDGLGAFGPQLIIDLVGVADTAVAADLDGDGDADVVASLASQDTVAWYENLDGAGSFGDRQVISRQCVSIRAVAAADLDGDGDRDVLSASRGDHKVSWYENLVEPPVPAAGLGACLVLIVMLPLARRVLAG